MATKAAPAHMTANPWGHKPGTGRYVPHQHAQGKVIGWGVAPAPPGYANPLAHKTAGTGKTA